MNNIYISWSVVNLAIIGLVILAIYLTHSLWALLELFFLFSKKSTLHTKCPNCKFELIATEIDEKEE